MISCSLYMAQANPLASRVKINTKTKVSLNTNKVLNCNGTRWSVVHCIWPQLIPWPAVETFTKRPCWIIIYIDQFLCGSPIWQCPINPWQEVSPLSHVWHGDMQAQMGREEGGNVKDSWLDPEMAHNTCLKVKFNYKKG